MSKGYFEYTLPGGIKIHQEFNGKFEDFAKLGDTANLFEDMQYLIQKRVNTSSTSLRTRYANMIYDMVKTILSYQDKTFPTTH